MITPLFGKAIYSAKLDIDTKKIVPMIDVVRKARYPTEGVGMESLYVLEEKKFKFLKDIVLKAFNSYAYDGMRYKNKFKITTSWFTEFEKNEDGQTHRHENACISGVLYLQTAPNCGDIIFHDLNDRRYDLIPNEYNILNSKTWQWTPEEGVILFFPAEVYHRVEKNLSKITRYSLAFNLIPVGLIGVAPSDSHVNLKYKHEKKFLND